MPRTVKIVGSLALGLLVVVAALALAGGSFKGPVKHTKHFTWEGTAAFPPPLSVAGARLVTATGATVRLRGVMPIDPNDLRREGAFNRETFAHIAAAGANVVRIPVHPIAWLEDDDYLWRYLEPAVGWAGEHGMYVIIDWHSIGNVRTGRAPLMPELYAHTLDNTRAFWQGVASHFATAPNVLFELFNEPQGISADEWQASAQELVGLIRAAGAPQPIIVGGLEYARELDWVLTRPIADAQIIYAAHIYPGHALTLWDFYFGRVAERHPVLITEWGFMDENPSDTQPYLNGSAATYGAPLMAYLDARGIGWVACWWHDAWQPPMFTPHSGAATHYGDFVLAQLR